MFLFFGEEGRFVLVSIGLLLLRSWGLFRFVYDRILVFKIIIFLNFKWLSFVSGCSEFRGVIDRDLVGLRIRMFVVIFLFN